MNLMADKNLKLLLVPALAVWSYQDADYLDSKFVVGLRAYAHFWPGAIRLVMYRKTIINAADFGMLPKSEIPKYIELIILDENSKLSSVHLNGVSCVLASADNHKLLKTYLLCQKARIPLVHDIEYTLRTRLEFLRAESRPLLKYFRTWFWLRRQEVFLKNALRHADAIQANGLPAFMAYHSQERNDLVYFDNRITNALLITDCQLNARLVHLSTKSPLRLAFSGRLIRAKGADALIDLAVELVRLGVDFCLDIFGAGELESYMKSEVIRMNLARIVRMRGAIAFETALLPYIKNQVDVFVCCHRQGDPSCTYIETYGCGVPIAGFANEAHSALVQQENAGWATPMDDIATLAKLLKNLNVARDEIEQKSRRALEFAKANIFEVTFTRRMAHCLDLAHRRNEICKLLK